MRGGPAGKVQLDGPVQLVAARAPGRTADLLRIPPGFGRVVVGAFVGAENG